MEISAVIGLGNPGQEYAATRHNLGFQVIDGLAERWTVSPWEHRYKAKLARRRGSRSVYLIKPQTYMNRSGDSVQALVRSLEIPLSECLIVVDDVELPLGQLRLRSGGGPGTHNGLRSIVDQLGDGFPRLRLGIRGEHPWNDLADYVLAPFGPEERALAEAMVARAVNCIEMALHSGIARAANLFNQSPPSESPANPSAPTSSPSPRDGNRNPD